MSDQTCGAETKSGEPCERSTDGGRCWMHDGQRSRTQARYEPGEVAEALLNNGGVVVDASDELGCTPRTVHRYIDRFDSCGDARDDGRRQLVDEAQSTLRELLHSDDDRIRLDAAETILRHYAQASTAAGPQAEGIRFVYDEDDDRAAS